MDRHLHGFDLLGYLITIFFSMYNFSSPFYLFLPLLSINRMGTNKVYVWVAGNSAAADRIDAITVPHQ